MANQKIVNILKKMKHHSGRVYTGYITQTEYLTLIDDGARPVSIVDIVIAKECVQKGLIRGGWRYLFLTKVQASEVSVS